MSPSQVLDMRNDLLTRMDGQRFSEILWRSFTADLGIDTRTKDQSELKQIADNATYLLNSHRRHVRSSECYLVTPEMQPLLVQAARTLDATDTWSHDLAPSREGIVRFDDPVLVTDVRGKTMKAHWLIWGPGLWDHSPVTICSWYNDPRDPDEIGLGEVSARLSYPNALEELEHIVGRWFWVGSDYRSDGTPLGNLDEPVSEITARQIAEEGDSPSPVTTNLNRYVHALWLLLGQTIVQVEDAQIERASQRRARKMNLPGRVSVIRLRRTASQRRPEGEASIEWQHRWTVRGHWRWAHVSARHPQAQEVSPGDYRARVWIEPYLKGPEDAPFKITEKVNIFNR